MSKQDNRSDAALRERLKIAGKATPGSWSLQDKGAIPLVYGPNGERIAKAIDNLEDTAHIAASSPDVVRADIEEILRLREEVARLNKEADWLVKVLSLFTEECPYRFYLNYEERIPIPPVDGCEWQWPECHECDIAQKYPGKCWRETARKAVEEEERHG